ncbi:4Fe-4S dicluster domain-containing protein [Polyangium mundeleinium]|uniref:4Fe-4S dicluster domain-containing protein n=1 Tax=Polyangium mundeleinium TaxID=2995306 RepID=UPI00358DB15F
MPHAAPAPLAPDRAIPASAARLPVVLAAADLDALVRALAGRGYRVLGPVARDGAIVIDDVRRATDLPIGLEDVQGPGRYRLERRDHDAFFAFTLGPHSWKETFHVPVERLFQIRRNKEGFSVIPDATPRQRVALLGARACEIHAIEIQDRILIHGEHPDPRYAARRSDVFVVAVNCMRAGNTCFCASMGTGPRAERGFDLALTELMEPGDHRFLVEIGSDEGAAVAAELPVRPADPEEKGAAVLVSERTAATMGRRLDTSGLKERLQKNLEHPRWDDVATRCLACGNCTMVCPTCFCTEFEDTTDLAGETAERTKRWESCFALAFSHVHGGSVRSSIKARYRQWLTHKLAGWHDQFGSSGCVGCGRCITWCPVGIDITEEAAAVGLPEKDG